MARFAAGDDLGFIAPFIILIQLRFLDQSGINLKNFLNLEIE